MVLYMVYYPPHLKYVTADIPTYDQRGIQHVKTNVKSDHWRLSIILSWVVAIHMCVVLRIFYPSAPLLMNIIQGFHNFRYLLPLNFHQTSTLKPGWLRPELSNNNLGNVPRCDVRCSRRDPVLPSAHAHVSPQVGWCAEHSDDGYPEPRGSSDGPFHCYAVRYLVSSRMSCIFTYLHLSSFVSCSPGTDWTSTYHDAIYITQANLVD